MTITQSENVVNVLSDLIVHDCHFQITHDQYNSILEVADSFERMYISWDYLAFRPQFPIMKDKRGWWRYAYQAVLEQKIRPYTWSRLHSTRRYFRKYSECFKELLSNPNDIELKMDLQKYEDKLSIVNVVVARRLGRMMVMRFINCNHLCFYV